MRKIQIEYVYQFSGISSNVLGFGNRIGIWTIGCNRRCYNRASPFLWNRDEKFNISLDNLIFQIDSYIEINEVDV